MLKLRVTDDPEECARLWTKAWPQTCVFDLWPVRKCFASGFGRQPYFVVAEQHNRIEGLLALSWIEEGQYFGLYPGETWQTRTWLEQNKIPATSRQVLTALLDSVRNPVHLRYLTLESMPAGNYPLAVDEVGYLFFPGAYNFSFKKYMEEFSGKSRKKLSRELAALESYGVAYRYDCFADLDRLFATNRESFGPSSYFNDPRFLASFEKLAVWLQEKGMLRITAILLGGRMAAIDIGAVFGDSYTVLAGATWPEFVGVAKMINFHHIQWACSQRFKVVDFLCGDFGWKKRFHLTERPLYDIKRPAAADRLQHFSTAKNHIHER